MMASALHVNHIQVPKEKQFISQVQQISFILLTDSQLSPVIQTPTVIFGLSFFSASAERVVFTTVNINYIFILNLFHQKTLQEFPSFDWFSTQTASIRVSPHKYSFVTKHHRMILSRNDFFDLFSLEFVFSDSNGSLNGAIESAFSICYFTFDF
jgi:hypothetical protein